MQLYLLRHGEAAPASAGGSDEARELADEGRRDVRAVAEAMLRAGARPQAIYTSPLLRARQTGQILEQVSGLRAQADERLQPGATIGAVQELLAGQPHRSVVIIGHEPDLSGIARQLTGGRVKLRTSALARIDAEKVEPAAGVLVWLLTPELAPASEL